MLAPADSPIHTLLLPWWQAERRPSPFQAQAMREALFTAALAEILAQHATGKSYDPIIDHRFLWAVQYLEKAEGSRRHVDEDVAMLASLCLHPTPLLSNKDLAANP